MMLRKAILGCGALVLVSGLLLSFTWAAGEKTPAVEKKPAPAKETTKPAEKPRVEVVFCLDTTGSMSGLIDAAKKKIWSISNQIAGGTPTPSVKVGLVAYRDRGDAFVTKVFDLTEDLDSIYTHLMSFRADGGGDTPESVNQALFDAVHKVAWSKDKKVLRMIFLVGDAPPHMDYKDEVQYPETCKEAVKRDIIINTVLCGPDAQAKDHWVKMCRAAEGSFVQIDAGGGPVVAVATPFDDELAKINTKISATTLHFGDADKRRGDAKLASDGAKLKADEAAERAAYYSRIGGGTAYDLLQNVKEGKVKLESLKKDELPKILQDKTLVEQKEILNQLDKQRLELSAKAMKLDRQRNAYIAEKQAADAKLRPTNSFDNQVLGILRDQATRINLDYATPPGKKK